MSPECRRSHGGKLMDGFFKQNSLLLQNHRLPHVDDGREAPDVQLGNMNV